MSIALRIIKRIFALLFALLVIFVVGVLIWRIVSSENSSSMETLYPNARLSELYKAEGEELYMLRQEQRSITSAEENYGYFAVTDYVIIPDANQVQATLRYNNSTLRHTADDYALDEVPSRDENTYDVTLLVAIDLTPDNKDDNLGNDENGVKFVRCHGEVVASEEKNLYNFRRIVFDLDSAQIDISELMDDELLLAVYADIYYSGDINYEEKPYGVLCLYDFKSESLQVALDKKDIKALESFE